jgi:signal transduction histidine kinase
VLLEIGQEAFLRVLGRSPALGIRILVRLTDRLRDADQQSIMALRKTNEELNRTLAKLERLDRTKTDFIQVSAHELRTPVTALLGYAQMMQANPAILQDSELRMLVEGLVNSTERLNRIFGLILDASRVVADELQVVRSPVSIPLIFEAILAKNGQALAQRNLTLERVGLGDLPIYPAAPDMLQKAFHHLVNNAIKYTPDGGKITVAGRVVEAADLGRCVEVTVQDTGIGIAPENLELIFEKFYHTGALSLHSSGTTAYKGDGPGLGLTIARGVIQAHGGRIWAESPAHDERACPGSRFVVHLPLSAAITGVPEDAFNVHQEHSI